MIDKKKHLKYFFKKIVLLTFLFYFNATPCFAHQSYGGQSMVMPLKKVLVRRPDSAFDVKKEYLKWHYTSPPNLEQAQYEHDQFVGTLRQFGVEVIYHDEPMPDHADAIFVHDPVIMTDQGAIILKMGKALRVGEEAAIEKRLKQLNIPIFYKLKGNATAEGGDILWLNSKTLLIGRGFRTNEEGIKQITKVLKPYGVSVKTIELPYDQGPEACLHLQSLISMVDEKTAVVYKKHLPVSFLDYLNKQGITLIDVPDSEYPTMGPNILAIKPKVVLTIEGNTKTKRLLEEAGVKVYTYKGNEISHKAEGGATCLTRPLLRAI